MNILPLITALSLTATSAFAVEVTCAFTLECFDTEPCIETDYAMAVKGDPDTPNSLTLETVSETLTGTAFRREGPMHMIFPSKTALHLISANTNNKDARYSVHMAGPLAITYHGTCKGLN